MNDNHINQIRSHELILLVFLFLVGVFIYRQKVRMNNESQEDTKEKYRVKEKELELKEIDFQMREKELKIKEQEIRAREYTRTVQVGVPVSTYDPNMCEGAKY